MKTPVVHWISKNRCDELDGTTSIWTSAACRSHRPRPKKQPEAGGQGRRDVQDLHSDA